MARSRTSCDLETNIAAGLSESHSRSSLYGHSRSMLPPSPQHYQPRFPPATLPTPPVHHDGRTSIFTHKRPGSSMSISSMLGGEPDRALHESRSVLHTRTPSQPAPTITPLITDTNNFVFPSHHSSKPTHHDYSYKPRSQTPDRFGSSFLSGPTRQRSSSSGMAMQRPDTYDEPHNRSAVSTPATGLHDPFVTLTETRFDSCWPDHKLRRTSVNGLLNHPTSQPSGEALTSQRQHEVYPATAPALANYDRNPPPPQEVAKQNGASGTYDTKPPGMNGLPRSVLADNVSPAKSSLHSVSPELQRSGLNGTSGRSFHGILNGPTSQPLDAQNYYTSQRMVRQDSAQSQSDRSVFGDRPKFRPYSPFNTSFISNPDEPGRKGSDELSQHRAILGLAQENKRGRYSPLPQAMQGAQAQSPVPDAGAKSGGRVFSGIGGGIRTTPTPNGMPSSPFKRDEESMRLSEDNVKGLSRPASGTNKRSRKVQHDDGREGSGIGAGEKHNGRKRGKHQHNYKADLEEMAHAGFPPREGNMTLWNSAKKGSIPREIPVHSAYYQPRTSDAVPAFRFPKVIRVGAVYAAASKKPRRHLGNFTYRPKIEQAELVDTGSQDCEVSIKPNLLPTFTDPDNVNCTYTIHVPRMWLQSRERGLISHEHHVWGSGIYTDDSDPVAAAMHAGYLKPAFPASIDTALLGKVVQEQNPRVEYADFIQIPAEPADVVASKDLRLLMVVLPLLEHYEGSNRHGIRSRTWPAAGASTPHDGVSFGILSADWVDIGTEELRVGRTGQGRRERLRLELESRRRGIDPQRQRLARPEPVVVVSSKQKDRMTIGMIPTSIPRSVPATASLNQHAGNVVASPGNHFQEVPTMA